MFLFLLPTAQALYAVGAMQAHGIGGPRDCAGALNMFRSVVGRLPQTPSLANGHELLADGKPQGAWPVLACVMRR